MRGGFRHFFLKKSVFVKHPNRQEFSYGLLEVLWLAKVDVLFKIWLGVEFTFRPKTFLALGIF